MRKGRFHPTPKQTQHRINHQIKAPEVRVIGQDNKLVGAMSLSQALQHAQQVGLDLVEIAPLAQPPVVKIIDYRKFQYLEAKKQSKQKKGIKKGELKEVRLTPFMADADYQYRIKKIKEFLTGGYQVRVTVQFTGRQLAHKEFGYQLINRLKNDLSESAKLDQEPKFIGRQIISTISKK